MTNNGVRLNRSPAFAFATLYGHTKTWKTEFTEQIYKCIFCDIISALYTLEWVVQRIQCVDIKLEFLIWHFAFTSEAFPTLCSLGAA